jgi:hypothetical protein
MFYATFIRLSKVIFGKPELTILISNLLIIKWNILIVRVFLNGKKIFKIGHKADSCGYRIKTIDSGCFTC